MGHSAGTAGRGRWGGSEVLDDGLGVARRGSAHSTRGSQVWRECEEDQADGPRVASGQGMVLSSGTGIPGEGQGEGGQGMVSRSGGDEGMEGQDGQ